MTYKTRVVDQLIGDRLRIVGGVVLEGVRGCGKTSTGLQNASSSIRLDALAQAQIIAEQQPELILEGPNPRLIDEWQLAPAIWNHLRHTIDAREGKGQFILSGSATPDDDITRHTGAGRFIRIRMRPMSLWEYGASSGEVSLRELHKSGGHTKVLYDNDKVVALRGTTVSAHSPQSYLDLAHLTVRGGLPETLDLTDQDAADFNAGYLQNVAHTRLTEAAFTSRLEQTLEDLLGSLVRRTASNEVYKAIAKDLTRPNSAETVTKYLDVLQSIFLYEPLPPWSVSLRSKSRLAAARKICFADPALPLAALGIDGERLALQPDFFGQVFEAMVVRDLRVYAEADRGRVFHYQDNTGLEVDAIIDYRNTWAGVEVKLGSQEIPKAEANLLRLANKVDFERGGQPAFLAIVTATEYAYTLPSGVHVIPLACLRD